MAQDIQLSALVSKSTKEMLENYVRKTGLKKGHLIEQALLHHIQALENLPLDVGIHPKILVTSKSGEKILEHMNVSEPTQALRELMQNEEISF